MGLEGAVKLAYRKELAAIEDAAARSLFDQMVSKSYEENKGLSGATFSRSTMSSTQRDAALARSRAEGDHETGPVQRTESDAIDLW